MSFALGVSITATICELLIKQKIDSYLCYTCSYNDVRENGRVRVRAEAFEPLKKTFGALGSGAPPAVQALLFLAQAAGGEDVELPINGLISEQEVEEDFPKNRADSDFFTFYWFVVVYPIAALLTIAHLILHGVPVLGFILSIAVSSQLKLICCLHV